MISKNNEMITRRIRQRKMMPAMIVSSSWDKLTPVTEEGTKLVCSSLFFLAFYKNRHKNRNGNEKAVHLRVERPCVTRRVSACLRPKTKRGEKLLLSVFI